MSAYSERASRIKKLTVDLRHQVNVTAAAGTLADKQTVIDFAVEAINKLLYSFMVSQEMFDSIGTILNDAYEAMEPTPDSVNHMLLQVREVLHTFEGYVDGWVAKHCVEE